MISPPTETPLGIFASTATRTATVTATITASGTPTPTPTPTGSATLGLLVIHEVRLVSARRDPTRDNGAIAVIEVLFGGGKPPYTFADDGFPKPGNPYSVNTTCGADLVHTATVSSHDGQTASKPYFVKVNCPP